MNKKKVRTWNTKDGPRRVRHEEPTLQEAIAAAQGLTDEIDAQAEIAAALIGLPRDRVRAEILKMTNPRKDVTKSVMFAGPSSAPRAVVVERKPVRRTIAPASRILGRDATSARRYH
jgi:hypothetical protein